MKVSNIVISAVVAISTAGALGLAYAQSTYSDPQPGTAGATSQGAPGSQDSTGTTSQDSAGTSQDSTGSTGTTRSGTTYNERVARADRN